MPFQKPDRSTFTPNFAPTPENEVVDVGFGEGELSDGRPFRIEYWVDLGIGSLTYLMPIEGLEDASKDDLANLLVREGLIEFRNPEHRFLVVSEMQDSSGNRLLALNTVIGDEETLYAEGKFPLTPYPGSPWE